MASSCARFPCAHATLTELEHFESYASLESIEQNSWHWLQCSWWTFTWQGIQLFVLQHYLQEEVSRLSVKVAPLVYWLIYLCLPSILMWCSVTVQSSALRLNGCHSRLYLVKENLILTDREVQFPLASALEVSEKSTRGMTSVKININLVVLKYTGNHEEQK